MPQRSKLEWKLNIHWQMAIVPRKTRFKIKQYNGKYKDCLRKDTSIKKCLNLAVATKKYNFLPLFSDVTEVTQWKRSRTQWSLGKMFRSAEKAVYQIHNNEIFDRIQGETIKFSQICFAVNIYYKKA
ncbi:hypothetical protein EGR_10468 [Echinococcus granulosus]|uniref:Uncharacterized protein n=1 Tax=Echinococcus granulosus TaxID=6210 RepID=W6UMF3_ECHGR|nr:hypothetical protein EGR_10468 [Echinococcus granulosus]EUB54669.1 hypothetical protein EGR_10468 [Echinococcus granulosus]